MEINVINDNFETNIPCTGTVNHWERACLIDEQIQLERYSNLSEYSGGSLEKTAITISEVSIYLKFLILFIENY